MKKNVYKLRPSGYWRIGEHESWFSDMAAKGFHLKKTGIHFAKFVKGEPKKMQYRIDVSTKKRAKPEQIQMYAESGWDYVTSFQYFHVFSSPEERDAPELHTDPAEQSYTLEELDKKLTSETTLAVFGMILIIGLFCAIWFQEVTSTFLLVEGMGIQHIFLTIILLYSTYNALQAFLSIRGLKSRLLDGRPINHHAPWKKYYRRHAIVTTLFLVVGGVGAAIPFIQLVKMDTKTLPVEGSDLPIVRLADIERNPALIRPEPSYISNGVDWGNRYSYNWSPIAPVQYETDEGGIVSGESWEDGSGEYSPHISTKVYQLRFPSLSDQLINDLVKRYIYDDSGQFVEMDHPNLDNLIVYIEEPMKKVFASKGKAVMYVSYFGYANIDTIIYGIVEKIEIVADL